MTTVRAREGSASSHSSNGEVLPQSIVTEKPEDVPSSRLLRQDTNIRDSEGQAAPSTETDVFGNEEGADVRYKTCEW
jgi:hypothetical protein